MSWSLYIFNSFSIPKTLETWQSQQNWWKKIDILVWQNKICCHSHRRKCSKSCFSTALFYYVLVQRCICTPPCPNWPSLGLHPHQASVRGRLNLTAGNLSLPPASLLSLEDVLQGWEWPWFMNIKEGKMREGKNRWNYSRPDNLEYAYVLLLFCCVGKSQKEPAMGNDFVYPSPPFPV